jgi:hypothetical protein
VALTLNIHCIEHLKTIIRSKLNYENKSRNYTWFNIHIWDVIKAILDPFMLKGSVLPNAFEKEVANQIHDCLNDDLFILSRVLCIHEVPDLNNLKYLV